MVIPGKLSVADVNIVNLYIMMNDAKINCASALKKSPTMLKIVAKIQENKRAAAFISQHYRTSFFLDFRLFFQ